MIRGLVTVALAVCGAAYAASPASCPPPTQKAVCDAGVVTKGKLANYALDACGVSRTFEDSMESRGALTLSPSEEALLTDGGITLTRAERLLLATPCTAQTPCAREDAQALESAQNLLDVMLNYEAPAYRNIAQAITARQFFEDPKAQLVCGTNGSGQTVEAPGAVPVKKPNWSQRLRVRGSTDGLFFMNIAPQFSAADKASVGSTFANSNDTRTDKIIAVVGYAVNDPMKEPLYNLFPYLGVNRNIARPTGKSVSVNSDTVDFGFLNSFDLQSAAMVHWVTLRPDLLVNHKDQSHLLTASTVYTPIKNCPRCLNDYYMGGPLSGIASIEPILDLRSDFGHYTQAGNSTTTDYKNYWRIGPRAGFSVTSENPFVPLDLTVIDVYLQGVSGSLPRVNYFKSVLSYKILGKFVGLDLSFSHGRREDTAQPEHQWSIAFSGAY